jgi:hypothetical protein
MLGDAPKRFPKIRLSKKTLLEVGHALETSASIHVVTYKPGKYDRLIPKHKNDPYVNTGHKACEEALKLLKRALRLPKDFSFTTASVYAFKREMAQWPAAMRRRRRAKETP